MISLLRAALKWTMRHFLIFLLIGLALVLVTKLYEAYTSLPALAEEVGALERQQAMLNAAVRRQIAQARSSAAQIEELEAEALTKRLGDVRGQIASMQSRGYSRVGFAADVLRGNTEAIAHEFAAGFRLQLLQKEEAAIAARLELISGERRLHNAQAIRRNLGARAAALERLVTGIEQRHPILSRGETVPGLRNLQGPWRELREARKELRRINAQRVQLARAQQEMQRLVEAAIAAYRNQHNAMLAAAPQSALQQAVDEKRSELSRHWARRAWNAAKPVLSGALWITVLVIAVPPLTKAFWFFIVAPLAERLRPVVIDPHLGGSIAWENSRTLVAASPPGSAVSRRIVLHPGEELIVKPEYLQSSMNGALIDSTLVLSSAIPFGSLATGLVGLTRIRATRQEFATISATQDVLDEIGVIEVQAGAGVVFKPRSLIGVLQRSDRPLRIRSVWRLGHLSAWLTLQLRFLIFEGPCCLIVKGIRGVALEPSNDGRRIAGAATLGWSANLAYSVRRSETFVAYLMGKQSLFNDSFTGQGFIIYEEVPRSRIKSGLLGRGLEGLGEGLLKVVGL